MSRIRILDDATINQIAAGEVIENPASVVKELVENAIDAGASEICIETMGGGRSLIQVADDGCGMGGDDLLLSVERHATSKLTLVGDLERLNTLGFRGEALPSIAAVSKMSLHSAPPKGAAHLLTIEGGKMGPLKPSPRRQGTTIEVRSLFFNVPVRKKFQKSLGSDTAEIHKTLTKFALCHTDRAFSWTHEGERQLTCGRGEGLAARIQVLLGNEWGEGSLPVESTQGELSLTGRISKPSFHRPHRSGQYLFINQRSVVSPWFAQKVLEAYGNRLSPHRYPLFVLYLTLPPSWVDVNVHPQKREVRLREEERLAPFILTAIGEAFEKRSTVHLPPLSDPFSFHEPTPLYRASAPEPPYLFEETSYHIVGQVKHYFFVEERGGVRVVDGLRASERIVFDQLQKRPGRQEVQALLIPIQMSLKGRDYLLLSDRLEELHAIGFGIRPFGGDVFLIDAIPAALEPDEVPDWILLYLEEGRVPHQLGKCLKRSFLSPGGGASLVKKLFQCENPDLTPSGKPIHYLLDAQKLESLLK